MLRETIDELVTRNRACLQALRSRRLTLLWVAAGAFAAATPLVAWALVTEETAAVSVGWTF